MDRHTHIQYTNSEINSHKYLSDDAVPVFTKKLVLCKSFKLQDKVIIDVNKVKITQKIKLHKFV